MEITMRKFRHHKVNCTMSALVDRIPHTLVLFTIEHQVFMQRNQYRQIRIHTSF